MPESQRVKRRGFVMTGGGAKGLYEAGVIHAFHIAGAEFDVITGSSIGAFNAVFFAEYQLRKKQLAPDVRNDPGRAVEAMDDMVKAYHAAWLRLPDIKIIDDSANGPIGRLKDDLLSFNVSLPDLTRIAWWWTDPDRRTVPPPGVWPALVKLGQELVERLGGVNKFLHILKFHRKAFFQQSIQSYLARFGIERSLVQSSDDVKLASAFTTAIRPLQIEQLENQSHRSASPNRAPVPLVDQSRTLRDYAEAGIDVRLTRANYRTGRLEISAYMSTTDFVRYMQKQAFRLQKADAAKIPLGSFRLQLPGNPNAIHAALASGRFPGVFAPYPLEDLYRADDPENDLLHRIAANWLDDPQVKSQMTEAYLATHPTGEKEQLEWEKTFRGWQTSKSMRRFFPQSKDVYVDGGAIDNTPSNSAIDATREWGEATGRPKSDTELELYVVFLYPEPTVEQIEVQDPSLDQVVRRTLKIQGASQQSSDATEVETINTFGRRGQRLGETLLVVLDSYQETLDAMDEEQRRAVLDRLRDQVRERGIRGHRRTSSERILGRMQDWAEQTVRTRLPLQVNVVRIYPDEMPLDTLQFTERLGYRQGNAIRMLTMGCYQTLWALRRHLEAQVDHLDPRDQQTLALVRKWMHVDAWPAQPKEQENLHKAWRCRRTACVFHAHHCPHGRHNPG